MSQPISGLYRDNMRSKLLLSIVLVLFLTTCKENITNPKNNDPVINSIVVFPTQVQIADSFVVYCDAYDIDDDSLVYDWFSTSGVTIKGASNLHPFSLYSTKENYRVFYTPDRLNIGLDTIRVNCYVRDNNIGTTSGSVLITYKANNLAL